MTEDRLSGLFDEIRNESAQTSISEVDQWIDAAVAAGATVGLLATLKLILIKKPLIMWTTLLTVTGGASLGAVMIFSKPEVKEKPVKQEVVSTYSVPAKQLKEEQTEEPVEQESPKVEQPATEPDPEAITLPEDMGTPVPVKYPSYNNQYQIPAYRKPQTTESFTKVHVSGALYVELSQGKACSILIEPETAKDLVQVEIQNGTLYLKNERNKGERREKLVVKVTVQDLDELFLSGATSLMTMHQFGLGTLSLEMDGASNANLNLKTTKLKGDFSGASNVTLEGTSENADLHISGAAQANLTDLSVKHAKLVNSGAGHAEISVSETLKADGSGASETYYKVSSGSNSIRVDVSSTGSAIIKDVKK
ncbi:head GIN domain-containing protein [Fluviicola sp.]|uniref:head GIN domain-containing protein n=1 Tax=Fluviicola sp. TaxID=1917219 RepID=UPI0031E1950C